MSEGNNLSRAIWTAVVALLLAAVGAYVLYIAAVPAAAEQIPYALYTIGGIFLAGFAIALGVSVYSGVKYSDQRQQMSVAENQPLMYPSTPSY